MAPNSQNVTPTPLLGPNTPRGIPESLKNKADDLKAIFSANKTVDGNYVRDGELPVLPPFTTRSKFNRAMDALAAQIGKQNIEINDKTLVDGWYMEHPNTHDAYSIVEHDDLVCSAVAYPGSTAEVQQIVRWANEYEIPIYPISVGRNLGYGGAAPRVRGSVVIDLGKRMTKVLEIDSENATVLLEPGVTYFRLYEELKARGLHEDLWIDVPDVGGGSVLGNACDRGAGYTPYGDHFGQHCGMEVVLPNGEVFRSGMGALPGSDCWQLFPYGFGPYMDGIFSQSNFGIVTKMGFNLMRNPGGSLTYMYTFKNDSDIDAVIDTVRTLQKKGLLQNLARVHNITIEIAGAPGTTRSQFDAKHKLSVAELIAIGDRVLPTGGFAWSFYGAVYGPPDVIERQLELSRAEWEKIDGAKFWLPSDLPPDHYIHSRVNVNAGKPELRELKWITWAQNGGHLFFSPISRIEGASMHKLYDICSRLHEKYNINFSPVICVGIKDLHVITSIIYDRYDPDEKRRAHNLLRELVVECAEYGFGEYRTHLLLQDQVMDTYSFNNNILRRLSETIKDSIDPNGILAPGRCGVWPKKYRNKGWELLDHSNSHTSYPESNEPSKM